MEMDARYLQLLRVGYRNFYCATVSHFSVVPPWPRKTQIDSVQAVSSKIGRTSVQWTSQQFDLLYLGLGKTGPRFDQKVFNSLNFQLRHDWRQPDQHPYHLVR